MKITIKLLSVMIICLFVAGVPGECRAGESAADSFYEADHGDLGKRDLKKWKEYYLEKARLYFIDGEFEKSVKIDHDLLLLKLSRRESGEVRERLGKAFVGLGKYEKAIKYFKDSIKFLGKDPNILFELARSYEGVDLDDEALLYYRKCVEIDEDFQLAFIALGRIYWKNGLMDKSLRELENAMELGEGNTELYNLASLVLERLSDIPRAVQMQKTAIDMEDRPEHYYRLGHLNFLMSEYENALENFNIVTELEPDSPDPLLYSGVICLKIKDNTNAEKFLKSALSKDSSNALAHFFLAVLYQQEDKIEEASESVQNVYENAKTKELINYTEYLEKKLEVYSNR